MEPSCSSSQSWEEVVGPTKLRGKTVHASHSNCDDYLAKKVTERQANTCKLCKTEVSSKKRDVDSHSSCHDSLIDRISTIPCPSCYSYFLKGDIREHIETKHAGDYPPLYDHDTFDVINFTNKLSWLNQDRERLCTENFIHRRSAFKACSKLKNICDLGNNIRQRLHLSPDDLSSVFAFIQTKGWKHWPFHWVCSLCPAESAECLPSNFRNDISMRIFALRHLKHHYEQYATLEKLVAKEWKYLKKELHEDVNEYFECDRDLSQKHRSVNFYSRKYEDSMATFASELVRRENPELLPQQLVLCLICCNPLFRNVKQHFQSMHESLHAHPEESEFRKVDEIAECQATKKTFVFKFLSYSETFKIKDVDDCESVAFSKWKCCISSEEEGHADDVCEFPSSTLLRLYVLKHIDIFHVGFFKDEFLDREWKLIQNDLRIPIDFRTYSPTHYPGFSLNNPDDFSIPFFKRMFASNSTNLNNFKICGFCFWCGPPASFMDHILQHNYVNTGGKLSPNELLAEIGDDIKKLIHVNQDTGTTVNKILTSYGRKLVKHILDRKAKRDDHADDKSEHAEESSPALHESETASHSVAGGNCQTNTQGSGIHLSVPVTTINDANISELTIDDTLTTGDVQLDIMYSDERSRETTPVVQVVDVPQILTSFDDSSPLKLSSMAAIERSINDRINNLCEDEDRNDVTKEERLIRAEDLLGESPCGRRSHRRSAEIALLKTKKHISCLEGSDDSHGSSEDTDSDDPSIYADLTDDSSDIEERFGNFDDLALQQNAAMIIPKRSASIPSQSVRSTPRVHPRAIADEVPEKPFDWHIFVRKNFTFDGDEPTLSDEIMKKIESLYQRKCPFCKKTIKTSRLNTCDNSVEESVLSHLIVMHPDEQHAIDILNYKRYKLHETQDDLSVIPPIFLLNPEHKTLVCSSCRTYSCERLYNLRIHFVKCVQKTFGPATPVSRSPNKENSYACPLKCGIAWKISHRFSREFSEIAHLFLRHFSEKEAYEMGLRLSEEFRVADRFPFLNVKESWASGQNKFFMCSKCEQKHFKSVTELAQHAVRFHQRLNCPLGCNVRRLVYQENNAISVILHVLTHLPNNEVYQYLQTEKVQAEIYMLPFKFNESVDGALKGIDQYVICSKCEEPFTFTKFRRHLYDGICHNFVSRKTLLKLKDLKSSAPIRNSNSTSSRRDRGHLKEKADGYIECPLCYKNFRSNVSYSATVSIIIHILSHHIDTKKGEDFLLQWKPENIRHEFPHIELLPSLEASKNLSNNRFHLVCAICEGKFPSAPALLKHLEDHELILNVSLLDKPCGYCGEGILKYGIGEDIFFQAAHLLEHHFSADGQLSVAESANLSFLDWEASIELSTKENTSRFRCAQCPVITNSSLSFLGHYVEHHYDKKCASFRSYFCPVCKKACNRSSKYGVQVSLLAHFVSCHPNSKEVFEEKWGLDWSSKEFPFVNARKSLEARKFVCNLCDSEYGTMSAILRHATVHHGLMSPLISATTPIRKRKIERVPCAAKRHSIAGSDFELFQLSESKCVKSENRLNEQTATSRSFLEEADDMAICTPVRPLSRASRTSSPLATRSFTNKKRVPAILDIADIDTEDNIPMSSTKSSEAGLSNRAKKRRILCQQMFSTPASSQSSMDSWLNSPKSSLVIPKSLAVVMGGSSTTGSSNTNLQDILSDGLNPKQPKSDTTSIFSVLPQSKVGDLISKKPPSDVSHIENINGFKCSLCSFVGLSLRDTNAHLRIEHNGNQTKKKSKPLDCISPCVACSEVFHNRRALLVHIQTKHPDHPSPYPCSYCSACFVSIQRVREHERRLHENALKASIESRTCKYCEAVFENPRNCQVHEKRHESGKQPV